MYKTILAAVLGIFLLTSCSSSRGEELSSIEGTWYFSKRDNNEVDECKKKSNTTFSVDGKYKSHLYETSQSSCEDKGVTTGEWKRTSENSFTIKNGSITLTIQDDKTMKLQDGTNQEEIWIKK